MALKRKPNGIYVLDHYGPDGKRKRTSTLTRDYALAKTRARMIELGIEIDPDENDTASAKPSAKDVTMSDLFRRCMLLHWNANEVKSQATIRSNVRILERLCGHIPVKKMNHSAVEQLQLDMLAEGSKPGTVKRKLDSLFKALRVALKWDGGDGSGVPILGSLPDRPPLTVNNWKSRIVSDIEFAEINEALRARIIKEPTRDWVRFRALIWFLRYTGCRLGEALGLVEDKLEMRGNRVWVEFPRYETKSDEPRVLPVAIQVLPYLDKAKERMIDERVFPVKPATAWYMWTNIRDDMLAKGYPMEDVTLHTFRHTCITQLVKKLPIQKVSLWAGHSSVEITMRRYGHLTADDFYDAVDELDEEDAIPA